jgi:hypothetical protein
MHIIPPVYRNLSLAPVHSAGAIFVYLHLDRPPQKAEANRCQFEFSEQGWVLAERIQLPPSDPAREMLVLCIVGTQNIDTPFKAGREEAEDINASEDHSPISLRIMAIATEN